MKFDPIKFEQDEYVFRIRKLLGKSPDGLDLDDLETMIRDTPGPDGELPTVSDATLHARLERALLWMAVHADAEFPEGQGDGRLLLVRPAEATPEGVAAQARPSIGVAGVVEAAVHARDTLANALENAGAPPAAEAGDQPAHGEVNQASATRPARTVETEADVLSLYRASIEAHLRGAPDRQMSDPDLKAAVKRDIEAKNLAFSAVLYRSVATQMANDGKLEQIGGDYRWIGP